ncbi:hypothetical protein CPC08DRAFT_684978 [Agrocybe pediades]|nr:hypothetical protein CPC08DRAFT_684978 [Agrocybe pediades]
MLCDLQLSCRPIIALPARITTRIAPEIYNLILINYCGSKSDLANFSTVSVTWLSLCNFYLFAEVKYRANFAQFMQSSSHATSTITPHIKKLYVAGNHVTEDGVILPIIKDFIFTLPNLRCLHLGYMMDIGIAQPPLSSMSVNGHSRYRLSSVIISSSHFAAFTHFIDLLEISSALEDLSLDNVSCDGVGDLADAGDTKRVSVLDPSSLKRINIVFCHQIVTKILNWLQCRVLSDCFIENAFNRRRSFPRLKSIHLPDILPEELWSVNGFLANVGSALEELDFGLVTQNDDLPDHQGAVSRRVLDLSLNINIKRLVFHHIILFHFPAKPMESGAGCSADGSPYLWLINSLSTISSTDIQSLGFHIWLSNESQLDILPWFTFDKIVAVIQPQQVNFIISGFWADTELVEGWFKKRLCTVVSGRQTEITLTFAGLYTP